MQILWRKKKIMNKIEIINTIKTYLDTRRGVGHTYSLVNGVKNSDTIVLVRHRQNEKEINQMAGKKVNCISLEQVPYQLRGYNKPLAIDNFALSELLGFTFDIIHEYQEETNLLRSQIRNYEQTIAEMKKPKK